MRCLWPSHDVEEALDAVESFPISTSGSLNSCTTPSVSWFIRTTTCEGGGCHLYNKLQHSPALHMPSEHAARVIDVEPQKEFAAVCPQRGRKRGWNADSACCYFCWNTKLLELVVLRFAWWLWAARSGQNKHPLTSASRNNVWKFLLGALLHPKKLQLFRCTGVYIYWIKYSCGCFIFKV